MGGGGHVQRAERGKHTVGVCDDGAGCGSPGAGLMRGLEGRVEALAGKFNAQNVYATMGPQ